jgi:glycosyltransferase involved in cell wall biosynthesis
VVIEALEHGLPIIAPSHCGFVDAITERCGFLITPSSPSALRSGIAQAIAKLEQDELHRRELARGAISQAEQYDWKVKAKTLKEIYDARSAEEPR